MKAISGDCFANTAIRSCFVDTLVEFRGIRRVSQKLSTLRDANYSNTTQDSLPVAGQALLNGLSTRKVPMKGFKAASLHSYPLPWASELWAPPG